MRATFTKNVVSVRRTYPRAPQWLWGVIGDPRNLTTAVPMLRDFEVIGEFGQGASLTEVHTIGGWPQKYLGRVTRYEAPVSWSMTSSPIHRFPWGLPHTVSYQVSPAPEGGEVSIRCSFRRQGLLRLLIPQLVVRLVMKRALDRILNHISRVAAVVNANEQ